MNPPQVNAQQGANASYDVAVIGYGPTGLA